LLILESVGPGRMNPLIRIKKLVIHEVSINLVVQWSERDREAVLRLLESSAELDKLRNGTVKERPLLQ
jgi:hypothetical protein